MARSWHWLHGMSSKARNPVFASMTQYSGWVTPAGEWLPLAGTHLETAAARGETDPDGAGWIHVVLGSFAPVTSVTVEQHTTLVKMAKMCNADLFWLKDCEVT